jgi:hypothetical protein
VTGKRVLAALIAVVAATVVVPPLAAWTVNRRRIDRAISDVATMAQPIAAAIPRLRKAAGNVDVLCGPGRAPVAQTPAARRWMATPRGNLVLESGSVPVDPWGNCYVVNIGVLRTTEPATLWVLSAGPNGVIDTPFRAESASPVADDVAALVR